MYNSLKTETCKKCKNVIAEPKELIKITKNSEKQDMTRKKEISQEKQILITEITSTLPIVALLVVGIYLLYLKTIGIEVSEWLFFNYTLFTLVVGFIFSLTLNEVLLKVYGGEFKFKRLVFRWTLMTSYFSLLYGMSLFLSILLPWATAFWQFFFGTLLATAIFLSIVWKSRPLFGRLDQGKW
jgi:cation transport ATPase